jgi:hypothetical protein
MSALINPAKGVTGEMLWRWPVERDKILEDFFSPADQFGRRFALFTLCSGVTLGTMGAFTLLQNSTPVSLKFQIETSSVTTVIRRY